MYNNKNNRRKRMGDERLKENNINYFMIVNTFYLTISLPLLCIQF